MDKIGHSLIDAIWQMVHQLVERRLNMLSRQQRQSHQPSAIRHNIVVLKNFKLLQCYKGNTQPRMKRCIIVLAAGTIIMHFVRYV